MRVEDVSIVSIADSVGTPFYLYSSQQIRSNVEALQISLERFSPLIAFAVKANPNISVLKLMAQLGCGADIVSMGEGMRAIKAGVDPSKIVFSGVGKTRDEMTAALQAGVGLFNIESMEELSDLDEVAVETGKKASACLRVNPSIAAGGHAKISTGKKGDKFGIPIEDSGLAYSRSAQMKGVELIGLDVHIGSQISTVEPYERAFDAVSKKTNELRSAGFRVTTIDLGGGFGVQYESEPQFPFNDYAELVSKFIKPLSVKIVIEPGRSLLANSGVLVASVIRQKRTADHNFLIIDAGMNDLMRPALYGAKHPILPVVDKGTRKNEQTDSWEIVGPICESSDIFLQNAPMGSLSAGALVGIGMAGAYGASISNEYNTRPLCPEVMVEGDKWRTIRARPSFDQMINREVMV
jgi:diaminopimelate decarboxylase